MLAPALLSAELALEMSLRNYGEDLYKLKKIKRKIRLYPINFLKETFTAIVRDSVKSYKLNCHFQHL